MNREMEDVPACDVKAGMEAGKVCIRKGPMNQMLQEFESYWIDKYIKLNSQLSQRKSNNAPVPRAICRDARQPLFSCKPDMLLTI